MADLPKEGNEEKQPRVIIGRIDSVSIYMIKEGELDMFENGAPADLQLNFGIALLSIAFTALAALFSATFESKILSTVFIVITILGIMFGTYLLIAWKRNHTSLKQICKKIRDRIPPEASIIEKQAGSLPAGDIKPKG